MKKKKQKTLLNRIGPKGIFVVGIIIVIVVLGIIVSNLQTKGYNSKAVEALLDCSKICTIYFPHSAQFTTDVGKASCEKSCGKVAAEIATGTPCEAACTKTLMGRAGVCKRLCIKAKIKQHWCSCSHPHII